MTGGNTVLVVDDEPAIRLLCRINLELDGHRVLEAATLGEARDALAEQPSLVLLDVHVGIDDGLDLLTEIRQDHPEMRVVLLTGTADLDAAERQLADDVLLKPFTLEQLASTVRRFSRV
jgi:DNA-binding NtrC family response regulator